MSETTNGLLGSALQTARHGYRVFPVHYPAIGRDGKTWCSCGKADCSSKAKHPLTPNGLKDATTDEKQIREWWHRRPQANIGIALDASTLVLDVDPRHGGDTTLRLLCDKFSSLPDTPTALTGGGGTHYWLRLLDKIKVSNSNGALGPGLDIKTIGGYVVAPPSVHISGKPYRWEVGYELSEIDIAEAPDWLLKLIAQSPPGRTAIPSYHLKSTKASATVSFFSSAARITPKG